jgi:predicted DNA-binding transcriptional regulator AlpA
MSPEESSPDQAARAAARCKNVSLSKWVNEPLPAWGQLLSAHDVARLTRRPRWVLLSMMALGQFPRKQRFHGRGVGWLRADVLEWTARFGPCDAEKVVRRLPRRCARQLKLPFGNGFWCTSRRHPLACSMHHANPHLRGANGAAARPFR